MALELAHIRFATRKAIDQIITDEEAENDHGMDRKSRTAFK
jgi:hypothetical protein